MQKIVRFSVEGRVAYGFLEAETVREVDGTLFDALNPTSATFPLGRVKLLYPCQPSKIFAVGLNYRSHLGARKAPEQPEIFYKPVSALQNPEDPIITPPESLNMHFEGEMVAVIGPDGGVFGVSCGNDVSERDWQSGPEKDLQWWRAKGSNTFAPFGPAIVTGLDFGNLQLETRVNGMVLQKQSTSDLLFDVATVIQRISRWVSLSPGDLIYTGTPGSTVKLNPGDVVEVELEHVGVLRNPVL